MTDISQKQGGWTPGPWAVHPHRALVVPLDHAHRPIGGSDDAAFDVATYAQEICAMHWPDRNRLEQEVKANARLIAAAPDLYEALEKLFQSYKELADSGDAGFWQIEDTDEGKQALAALSRANPSTDQGEG